MKPHVSDAAPAPGPATESHHGCEGRCPGPSKEDRPASPPSCHDTCKCPSLTCGRCCQHSGSQLQHTQNGPAAATAAAAAAAGGAEASGAVVLLSTGEASGGREVAQCSVGGRDEEGDYHSLQLQGSSVSRWGDTVAGEETMSEAGAMESLERLPHAGCARAHQGPSHVEATAVFEGRRVQGEGANWEASSEVAVLTIACAGNCECMGVCCGHGSAYDEHGNESDGRGSACDRCAGREQVVDLLALGVGNFSLSLPARCQMALALLLAQALQLQLQQRQAGVFKCWIDAVARVACPHSQSMTPSVAFWLHANVWYLPHLWLPHGLTGTGILLWPHFRPRLSLTRCLLPLVILPFLLILLILCACCSGQRPLQPVFAAAKEEEERGGRREVAEGTARTGDEDMRKCVGGANGTASERVRVAVIVFDPALTSAERVAVREMGGSCLAENRVRGRPRSFLE